MRVFSFFVLLLLPFLSFNSLAQYNEAMCILLKQQMVKFSGLTIKNKQNPNGDIEIITIGSRPGEKLSEELLIKGEFVKTDHPLIYREDVNSKISKDCRLWD